MYRKPYVGETVQYFHDGVPNTNPHAAIVCAVYDNTVSLRSFSSTGDMAYRGCVRHWSDPVLRDNPDIRRIEGCFRFVQEDKNYQPPDADDAEHGAPKRGRRKAVEPVHELAEV